MLSGWIAISTSPALLHNYALPGWEDITHVVAGCAVPEGEVRLRMTADKEKYVFEYEAAGEWKRVGQVSTRFVATEFQGRCFTGTVIGLYAASAMDLGTLMLVRSFRHERKESIC